MNAPLATHVGIYNELRERLKAAYGLEDGDEVLADTLEGETDLQAVIVKMLREAEIAKAMANGIKEVIEANRERKTRLELKAERIRAAVSWAMADAGLTKITAPDLTVSWRMGKPKIVTMCDPVSAPMEYVQTKTTVEYKFDNERIAAALDAGEPLEWAHYGNAAPVITVRSR